MEGRGCWGIAGPPRGSASCPGTSRHASCTLLKKQQKHERVFSRPWRAHYHLGPLRPSLCIKYAQILCTRSRQTVSLSMGEVGRRWRGGGGRGAKVFYCRGTYPYVGCWLVCQPPASCHWQLFTLLCTHRLEEHTLTPSLARCALRCSPGQQPCVMRLAWAALLQDGEPWWACSQLFRIA